MTRNTVAPTKEQHHAWVCAFIAATLAYLLVNEQALAQAVQLPLDEQHFSATNIFNGSDQFLYYDYQPLVGSTLGLGTSDAPITASGPNLKLTRIEQINTSTCANNSANNECNAILSLMSVGTASDQMQVNTLNAAAKSSSTVSGADVLAGNFVGDVIANGVGVGGGIYAEGRADTATGNFLGAEIRANNQTTSSYTYFPGGFSSGGIWITAQSATPAINLAGHGVALGSISNALFDVGYAATADSVKNTTFQDDSSSVTSIKINGTHTTQIAATGFSLEGTGKITQAVSVTSAPVTSIRNMHVTAGDMGLVVGVGVNGSDATSQLIGFYDSTLTAPQGQIARNGSGAVSYLTSSDQRLKNDVGDSKFGLNDLNKIKVHTFTLKADKDRHAVDGFFAQELAGVYPYAVNKGGDDPRTQPWGIDYGRLTPLLVKAIQDLDAKIMRLEAHVSRHGTVHAHDLAHRTRTGSFTRHGKPPIYAYGDASRGR